MVPLKSAVATGYGDCGPALLDNTNTTAYWYTRSTRDAPQTLTITISPSFTGTVGVIAFSALTAQQLPSGEASPHPYMVRLISKPQGTIVPISLQDPPPKLLKITITAEHRAEIELQVINTDSGSGLNSCAETGVVLWERKV